MPDKFEFHIVLSEQQAKDFEASGGDPWSLFKSINLDPPDDGTMVCEFGKDRQPNYTGYKRVKIEIHFIDNGEGAGYLRLVDPNGMFVKVWPSDDGVYDMMQAWLNTLPNEGHEHDTERPCKS